MNSLPLLALVLLAYSGANAETSIYLRYGAKPKITVTNAGSGTPIQITTQSPHGFKPGDVVWIWGVEGNTNADGTRRVKAVLSPTAFTISYMNGQDAAGNGSFQASEIGSWVGATVAYPLTPHPRLWLDGPSGEITARLKDPDGRGPAKAPRATASNPPWAALSSFTDANTSDYAWNGKHFGVFRGGTFEPVSADGAEMVLRQLGGCGIARREALDSQCRANGGNPGLR